MDVDICVSITGQKSGLVKGESTRKGREGQIEIDSWTWAMKRPTDYGGLNAGGQAVGTVEMKMLTFTKTADSSSCALMSMLNNNENITSFVLSCYKSGPTGASMMYFKVTLTNARVTNFEVQHGIKDISTRENWSFGFDKIRCEYTVQGEDGMKKGGMSFEGQSYTGGK